MHFMVNNNQEEDCEKNMLKNLSSKIYHNLNGSQSRLYR